MKYHLLKKFKEPFFYLQESTTAARVNNESLNSTLIENSKLVNTVKNITEYNELQRTIKESESAYINLFNNVELGHALYEIITDEAGEVIDYIITDANSDFQKITGLDVIKLIGKRATEVFAGMDHLLLDKIKLFGEVAATGKAVAMEYYSERTNGWYSVSCYSPKPGYTASIFSDITTRKNNEDELQKTKLRLLEAQALAHIGDWEVDVINKHYYWADELYRIYGFEPQEFIPDKKTYLKFIHPDDMEYVKNSMFDINLDSLEYRYIGRNNKTGWVNIKIKTGYDNNGNLIRLHGTVQDITARVTMENHVVKAKEIAEKSSIRKSEFIANMSHELRTPINVIFGAIQLFEMYMKDSCDINKERQAIHLKSMKQNCMRLLRLVNNLIDTTKIDSGFYSPSFSTYNIVTLIKQIAFSVSDYTKYRNIELIFESHMEDMLIVCDIDMIERIMLNLISNAIKFTKDLIHVNISKVDDTIIIRVRDNGYGIEKENQKIIFERYKQVSELLTRESEGSGIGLSLAKALIEMHGGNISVKSNCGEGCEFKIELPIKTFDKEEVALSSINYPFDSHDFIEKMKVEFSDIYK